MKRNVLKRKKEWGEGIAKTLHMIMNLNKSQKKSTKPFFFKLPFFNIIVIYENEYFVYKPNKSGV